ncbi:MAG: hypothetical protein ABI723_18215 [Bacteroidia bacterium]
MKKLFPFVITLSLLFGCQNQSPKTPATVNHSFPIYDSSRTIILNNTNKIASIQLAKDVKRLNELKKSFVFEKDEFNNSGWYVHKFQTVDNSYNRKCLKVHISSQGYIYLQDQYYADDWLFHVDVMVKIVDNIYNSR